MQTMTVSQFKSNFSEVLDLVQQGEDIAISYGKKKKNAALVPFTVTVHREARRLANLPACTRLTVPQICTLKGINSSRMASYSGPIYASQPDRAKMGC